MGRAERGRSGLTQINRAERDSRKLPWKEWIKESTMSPSFRSRLPALFGLGLLLTLLAACRTYPDYSSDFRFPMQQGDVARGQEAFVALNCHQCHLVQGVDLPAWA